MMLEHSEHFDESEFFFFVTDLVGVDKIYIEMYPAHKTNWQDGEVSCDVGVLLGTDPSKALAATSDDDEDASGINAIATASSLMCR